MTVEDRATDAAIATPEVDEKLREIWALIEKPWVRKMLRTVIPPTPRRVMGVDVVLEPQDNYTEFVAWEKGLPPEHEATAELAGRLTGQAARIVDVGANAGLFGLPILAAAGDQARLLAFEPNPVMRARLARNTQTSGLGAQVTIQACAVSDASGSSRMFFPGNGNLGQGRIALEYAKGTDGVEVPVRPLADCVAEAQFDRIDLLKVDVEGLEDRVIAPLVAAGLEGRVALPGMIYYEIAHKGNWAHPLDALLSEAGYRLERHFGENALYVRDEAAS